LAATVPRSSKAKEKQVSVPPLQTKRATESRLNQEKKASVVFKRARDPRVQVLMILAGGEQDVGHLRDKLSASLPAVRHHLAVLRHGKVVSQRRQGKINFYTLTDTGSVLVGAIKNLAEGTLPVTVTPRNEPDDDDASWTEQNRRRGKLIRKEVRSGLNPKETMELERL